MTLSIGIDIGGSAIKALVLDPDAPPATSGTSSGDGAVSAPPSSMVIRRNDDDPVAAVASICTELDPGGDLAVGIGIAGLVDHEKGVYRWGPHLPWVDLALGEGVANATGRKVLVDNDANVAALAEANLGAATDTGDSATVMLGSGIGVGIISGGRVLRGSGWAGEAGHMRMLLDGPPCHCGSDGCWETVVSGAVLAVAAHRLAETDPLLFPRTRLDEGGAKALAMAEADGSGAAGEVLDQAGRWLGRGIATLIDLLSPSVVVVGGGLGPVTRRLIGPARQVIRGVDRYRYRETVDIRPSDLGEFAGAYGAGFLALHYGHSPELP